MKSIHKSEKVIASRLKIEEKNFWLKKLSGSSFGCQFPYDDVKNISNRQTDGVESLMRVKNNVSELLDC